jgi:uncharacterized protein YejL (UPF0352 family)
MTNEQLVTIFDPTRLRDEQMDAILEMLLAVLDRD